MNNLINFYYGRYQQQTISSIEIAKMTGQNHNELLKECDILNSCYKKLSLPLLEQRIYITPNVKEQQREFLLTREQQSHLFILSIIDGLNEDSRQLMQHLLTQQKPVAQNIKKQKNAEPKIKTSKRGRVKIKTKESTKLKKVKPTKPVKPKKQKDDGRIEKGLVSIVDILKGAKISRGDAYKKLLSANVLEKVTFTNKTGKSITFNSIAPQYAHLGFNEKLKNSAKETQPLWFEAKKEEILKIIKSVK